MPRGVWQILEEEEKREREEEGKKEEEMGGKEKEGRRVTVSPSLLPLDILSSVSVLTQPGVAVRGD